MLWHIVAILSRDFDKKIRLLPLVSPFLMGPGRFTLSNAREIHEKAHEKAFKQIFAEMALCLTKVKGMRTIMTWMNTQ
jgi:hypothetical protein